MDPEMIPSCATCIYGKMKMCPYLMYYEQMMDMPDMMPCMPHIMAKPMPMPAPMPVPMPAPMPEPEPAPAPAPAPEETNIMGMNEMLGSGGTGIKNIMGIDMDRYMREYQYDDVISSAEERLMRGEELEELDFEDNDDETRAPIELEKIMKIIERKHPMIYNKLCFYGMSEDTAKRVVRRMIYLTLLYI